MSTHKYRLTTFPKLKKVFIGAKPGDQSALALAESLRDCEQSVKLVHADNQLDAARRADVVVEMGASSRSFGKPTLRCTGELETRRHSTEIRTFLAKHQAKSVAFITSNQAYWRAFRVVRYAFDWSKKDMHCLTDKQKKQIRLLRAEGWHQSLLAERFGVSQPAITFVVRGYSDSAYFEKLRDEGFLTVAQLAEKAGTPWLDVKAAAAAAGVEVHKTGPQQQMIAKSDISTVRDGARKLFAERTRARKARMTAIAKAPLGRLRTDKTCAKGHKWNVANTRWVLRDGKKFRACRACKHELYMQARTVHVVNSRVTKS